MLCRDFYTQCIMKSTASNRAANGFRYTKLGIGVFKIILCSLIFVLTVKSTAAGTSDFPPFIAKGTIASRSFSPEKTNVISASIGSMEFYHSNNWWRLKVFTSNPLNNAPILLDCMKIPDGTRWYIVSTNQNTAPAFVCPSEFPPPGLATLFVPWLALSPNPRLPLIDSHRMHRFINYPECASRDLKGSDDGYYTVKYLSLESPFISALTVSNTGIRIEVDVTALGPQFKAERFPAPFDRGFQETSYKVLQTTNLSGFTFPSRTVYKHFAPRFDREAHGATGITILTEILVTEIRLSLSEASTHQLFQEPGLFALDHRPAILPDNISAHYWVTNDVWKPASDPGITRLAAIMARNTKAIGPDRNYLWVRIALFLIAVIPPVFFGYRFILRRLKG